MSEAESSKLVDLHAIDLRAEVEMFDQEKSGIKQIIVEILQKALVDEELDPKAYQFDLGKTVSKNFTSNTIAEAEEKTNESIAELMMKETEDIQETKTSESDYKVFEEAKQEKSVHKDKTSEGVKNTSKNNEAEDEGESIQLTVEEEEEVLHHNEVNNAKVDLQSVSVENNNTSLGDDHKTTKETEKTEEIAEINPKQEEAAKDIKPTGSDSGEARTVMKQMEVSDCQHRNLWITNISQNTRAVELKQALSAYGKVIGVKLVTHKLYPGTCRYGYVEMETEEDANNCISKLNNSELNGHIIRIEKLHSEDLNSNLNISKRIENKEKSELKPSPTTKLEKEEKLKLMNQNKQVKKTDEFVENMKKTEDTAKLERIRDAEQRAKRLRKRSRSKNRSDRSLSSRSRKQEHDIMSNLDKIRDEGDQERMRGRERLIREEKRCIEEARRLKREREMMRIERRRLEKERDELMLLERERQKLEREKLELEKLELERLRTHIQEEERRIQEEQRRKRPASSYGRDGSCEDNKRVRRDRHHEEASPPLRFDPPVRDRDMRYAPRDRDATGLSAPKYNTPVSRESRHSKHEHDRSLHYRSNVRGDKNRIPLTGHPAKNSGRFERGSDNNGNAWNQSSQAKVFNSNNFRASQKSQGKNPWRSADASDRWNSSNSRNGPFLSNGSYSNNSNLINMGLACPPPPGIDDYVTDRYCKSSMRCIRN